jgi:hypothetical protein
MVQNTVCPIFRGGVSRKKSSAVLVASSSIIFTLHFMNISQFVKQPQRGTQTAWYANFPFFQSD